MEDENFFYYDDKMTIEGSLINLGLSDVENIVLIATFYNLRNQVVSIRECYIEKNKLSVKEALDFSVTVLLDEYTPSFTHYKLEVFFRDSLKTRQAKV